jgi:hypothetical protein
MKHQMLSLLLFGLASHFALAAEGIAFGPVRAQPGERVRLTSRSECREGVIDLTRDGKSIREVMRFYRERELSWTFREPAADGSLRGMVEVGKMDTYTTTAAGGREEKAQLIGTMKLRQIRHTAKKNVAVIDVSVRGSGGDFQADGTEQHAKIELKGQVMADLKTMLDESLELEGVLETRSGKLSASKKATLPMRLVVNKTFARGAGF